MEYSTGSIDGPSGDDDAIMYHDPNITVFGGQSGSPLWAASNGVVYGVVVSDTFATRITHSIFDQLQNWRVSDRPPSPAPPSVQSHSFNDTSGQSLTLSQGQLLAGSSDPAGLSLAVQGVTRPAHGTLTENRDGSFTYTPDPGFTGLDSFTFQATDGQQTSNAGTITINVSPPPQPSAYLVVYGGGMLYQYDASGAHYICGGVQSADLTYTPSGSAVYEVVFDTGAWYQCDASGDTTSAAACSRPA